MIIFVLVGALHPYGKQGWRSIARACLPPKVGALASNLRHHVYGLRCLCWFCARPCSGCSGFPYHEKPALQNSTSRWIHWTTSATTWAKHKTKCKSHIRKFYLLQATEKRMVFVKQLRSSSLTAKVIHPRFHKMRIYSLRKAKNFLKKKGREQHYLANRKFKESV